MIILEPILFQNATNGSQDILMCCVLHDANDYIKDVNDRQAAAGIMAHAKNSAKLSLKKMLKSLPKSQRSALKKEIKSYLGKYRRYMYNFGADMFFLDFKTTNGLRRIYFIVFDSRDIYVEKGVYLVEWQKQVSLPLIENFGLQSGSLTQFSTGNAVYPVVIVFNTPQHRTMFLEKQAQLFRRG